MKKNGVELIAEERRRQIEVEGWDESHDDEQSDAQISGAAAAYAAHAHRQLIYYVADLGNPPGQTWNWDAKWWKPTTDPIRNLVKAGALIAAEIDRLLRDPSQCPPVNTPTPGAPTP